MRYKPKYCVYPDCFHCPYSDCKWDGNVSQYQYNHSEEGIASRKRYDASAKGNERDNRKAEKRIKNGKNAEYCRRYYKKHREEILEKKRLKRQEWMLCTGN